MNLCEPCKKELGAPEIDDFFEAVKKEAAYQRERWGADHDGGKTDPDWFWLIAKAFFVVSLFIWFRASFPRYRYDQIMRLGWKVFIPLTLLWLVVIAIWMQTPWNIWSAPVRPTQGQAVEVLAAAPTAVQFVEAW